MPVAPGSSQSDAPLALCERRGWSTCATSDIATADDRDQMLANDMALKDCSAAPAGFEPVERTDKAQEPLLEVWPAGFEFPTYDADQGNSRRGAR